MRARNHALTLIVVVVGVLVVAATATAGVTRRQVSGPSAVSAAVATPTVVPTITVTAVGDICFASAPGRLIKSKGPKAPFSQVAAMTSAATVTVGNLECVLSKRGSPVAGKAYTFEGDPAAVQGLTYAGFDFLALGNNHSGDYGHTALLDTVANLNKAGIGHAGAGANWAAAVQPAILVKGTARIAFLSFCQIGPSSFKAAKSTPGTAYTLDLPTVTNAIKSARKQADYVIVAIHWGVEKQTTPTTTQVKFGRAAIDAGADLVLSHHPHVIEGIEFYKGKLIAYSLGNFVFSPGSAIGHDTLILSIQLTQHRITAVTARPFMIDGDGRPVLATGKNETRIIEAITTTSQRRGTVVTVSRGVVHLKAK
jgi:poly-gamma-glutamate synthesis protein (capsule biosynthesis protein)